MPRAKTIQVFLPDGDPQSVRIADITSRMVQATQVPRGVLSSAERRPELKQVGVYFLFGPTEEGSVLPVYIGESENCWVRLKQHHVDESKEWWTQAIVVTSKTQAFDKAQGRWLEWHATQKAQQVGRYAVGNQCAASQPHLAEPVRADLLDHFDTIQTLIALLGYPLFRPVASVTATPSEPGTTSAPAEHFYCKGKGGAQAEGHLTADGFVVLKGARARRRTTPSAEKTWVGNVRKRLVDDGAFLLDGETFVLTRDFPFSSPSTASSAILGSSSNGWTAWRDAKGQTLKERTNEAT